MRIETITRKGKEFAVIPVKDLQKLMDDAEMLADVKAYDAAKARLEDGEDELIPLEITERRLRERPPSIFGVSIASLPRSNSRRRQRYRAPLSRRLRPTERPDLSARGRSSARHST